MFICKKNIQYSSGIESWNNVKKKINWKSKRVEDRYRVGSFFFFVLLLILLQELTPAQNIQSGECVVLETI